jgi:hypothetical protein
MSNVTEIEQAIQKLPATEFAKFRQWFAEVDADRWDREFEEDVSAGRLDTLSQEAIDDLRAGRCKDL